MKNNPLVEAEVPGEAPEQTRLAAIDIGTNSIRCIVVEADAKGGFRVLDDEKATVRLGEGLTETGFISDAAKARALDALQRMEKISTGLKAEVAAVVATSAVRKALNRNDFIREVANVTGLAIDVISGDQEADLAVLSVQHNFDMDHQRYGMADIGGGSVEVVTATGRHTESVGSLELGVVFLTEKFLHSDPPSPEELKKLRKYVRKALKRDGVGDGLPVTCLIGSGGTMTNIGSMVMAMRGEQYESVHRYEVLHSEVIHLLAMLTRKSHKERLAISGLNPERADIILAGMILTDELMRRMRTNQLWINAQGIREGLILRSLQQRNLIPETVNGRDWRDSILDFARSCRFDEQHSTQVCRLAKKIFAAVAGPFALTLRDEQLLEAAALLHDIGYFISYDRHHKHSYHLIRHANLFGFTPRERELIANLARYHRKAKPKKTHENLIPLSVEDQQLVRRLGGILRLADGLDRRRNRQVVDISCQLDKNIFVLKLFGTADMSVELYGAQSKGSLFEAAFDCRLDVRAEECR
ncbi:Ppx/GppA phosphatase family protein [Pelobacter seleniigenes]|uniref:Ppx/GppA phosphatase family protein n=1 Tax=Pelobacter seleniigenes TaxID=407188 RepID=UPI00068CA292|nr:Ppx/GppA phosphatase family protein [Pelobacter seleniigenes]